MIDLENRVVQHFVAHRERAPRLSEQTEEDEVLPKIRRKDVLELNGALARGETLKERVLNEELAAFNFRMACEVCRSKTDQRKCARTLLEAAQGSFFAFGGEAGDVCEASNLFKPGELGRLGYDACMAVATGTMLTSRDLPDPTIECWKAVQLYERAASLCDHIKDVSEQERTSLWATAVAGSGRALVRIGELHSARQKLEQALILLDGDWLEDDWDAMFQRAKILTDLAQAESTTGKHDAAVAHRTEAVVALERLLSLKDVNDFGLVDPLRQMAELHVQDGRYHEARTALEQAVSITDRFEEYIKLPLHWPVGLLQQLSEVLKAGGWQGDAQDLATRALRDRGIAIAALLGHDGALAVCRLADLHWVTERCSASAQKRDVPASQAYDECQLLLILNADRDLVTQLAQEWRSIAESESPSAPSEAAVVFRGWPDRQYWEHLAQFYECVIVLQRVAQLVVKRGYRGPTDTRLLFPGFSAKDIDTLRGALSRGAIHKDHMVWAEPMGEEHGRHNTGTPSSSDYLPSDESPRVDLCVYTPPFAVPRLGFAHAWETVALFHDHLVWRSFGQLVRAPRDGEPNLRTCQMPTGKWRNHMNYILGGPEEDVPVCGRFYIGSAECCRASKCWKSHTKLFNIGSWQEQARKVEPIWYCDELQAYDFLRDLWQQAKEIAKEQDENGSARELDVLVQFERLVELESRKSGR